MTIVVVAVLVALVIFATTEHELFKRKPHLFCVIVVVAVCVVCHFCFCVDICLYWWYLYSFAIPSF